MKINLSSKLFLAVMALCTFAVGGMGLAAYLSFTRGFLGYLNEQALERIDLLVPRFEQAYREHRNWAFLVPQSDRPPEGWFHLIGPPRSENEPPGSQHSPPVSDLTGAFLRITLFDAQDRYVFGYPRSDDRRVARPLQVDGQTVGWLAMTPFESVSATGDQRFQASQVRSSLLIGLACLLVSAIIAFWITRVLLRPVRRVAQATHRLAAGDYSIRVPVTSRDEAGQLAGDFNRMAGALANNEQLRRDFMADISHELRTPLAVLRGELEAMEDGIRSPDAAGLRSLQAEVASLSKLVDDLFELSLAEVGGPTYWREPFDLAALVQQAVNAYQPRFAQNALNLSLAIAQEPLPVLGDERRLGQLFYNVLENSLRYTDQGGETQVRAVREGTHIVVDVLDSTPDVPAGEHERLFERFYRVDASRNRRGGGAGLGLAICRGIAEVHGGGLQAKPSPLGGLWLRLTLPVREGE